MPWFLGNSDTFQAVVTNAGIGAFFFWTLFWTGLALWNAARRGQRGWFIFFLLVHTAGVAEFFYIFIFAPKNQTPKPRPRQGERRAVQRGRK